MYIYSKNMFRLGAQLLWPVPVTCEMWPVKETRLISSPVIPSDVLKSLRYDVVLAQGL